MARINIEEKWWSDPRRAKLGQLLGNPYFTETVVVHAWRLAQEYWEKGSLIPGHIYVNLHGSLELLQSNLACLHENDDPNSSKTPTPIQHIASTDPTGVQRLLTHSNIIQQASIYVRGSKELLSWGVQNRLKRIAAGKKSAERPRDSKGRLLSRSTITQETSSADPAKPNTVQLSGSGSGSGSGSRSRSGSSSRNNTAGIRLDYPGPFEELWISYGRKGDKKEALDEYLRLSLAEGELQNLKLAITNYVLSQYDPKFRKDFWRFLKSDWREYLTTPMFPLPHDRRANNNNQVLERALAKAKAGNEN